MHDTLAYFARDPIHRRYHQDELTFAMLYEYSEHFIMPLSHDEMVHLKGSLYQQDAGRPLAEAGEPALAVRVQFTRPGKTLLFMGTELAPPDEWDHDHSLAWHLEHDPSRAALREYHARGSRTCIARCRRSGSATATTADSSGSTRRTMRTR